MESFDDDSYELAPLKKILAHGSVTVDDTSGGTKVPATAAKGRRMIRIQNLGSVAVYWGNNGVTEAAGAAAGIKVDAGASDLIDLGPDTDLYVIATASGSCDVRYAELGG